MRICTRRIKAVLMLLAFLASLIISAAAAMPVGATEKIVRVGYYTSDTSFQSGASDKTRKSGYAYDYLQKLSLIAGWKYEYVYGMREEIVDMIVSGKVDVVAGIYKTDKRMEQMFFSEYDMGLYGEERYFAISKKRPDIYQELNSAQEQLLSSDPNFTTRLNETYYPQETGSWLLSDEEKARAAENGTLTIGYLRGNLPLSDEEKDGAPTGVIKDLSEEISSYLKITVDTVAYDTESDMESALNNGKVDAIFPCYTDVWFAENDNVAQTNAIISNKTMLIHKGDSDSGNLTAKIAVSDSLAGQIDLVTKYYPNAQLLYYDSAEDVLEAVKNGEASCTMGSSDVMQLLIAENTKYNNLNIAYLDTTADFGFSVKRTENALAEILNKTIDQLNTTKLSSALIQYSNAKTSLAPTSFIRRNPIVLTVILIIVIAILFLLFVIFARKAKRLRDELIRNKDFLEHSLDHANTSYHTMSDFIFNMCRDIKAASNTAKELSASAAAVTNDTVRNANRFSKILAPFTHITPMAEEVLDMFKVKSGAIELHEKEFVITDLTDELISSFKPSADAKGHEVTANISGVSHSKVIGDSDRVRQAFAYIIDNAIKYTPDGGTIKITLSEIPDVSSDHACFEFIVEDNGIGMKKEYLPHIFDNFSRADSSYENKVHGSGLALPLARGIVRMMGGDIKVESTLGKGSKFTVNLFLKIQNEK